jgi:DNA-binding transcriptional MerR regulator
VSERPYLSIGEVLGLLLEEFPDVTISKIRFLESQGLIDPERTASGYRKFYDGDVDRLRVILREQRENFLPLRVIRDRLENGQIDDSGGLTPPRGVRNVTLLEAGFDETGELIIPEGTPVPTGHHPAAQLRMAPASGATQAPPPEAPPRPPAPAVEVPRNAAANFFAGGGAVAPSVLEPVRESYTVNELCIHANITHKQLGELESFGLLSPRGTGTTAMFNNHDLAIARACKGFLERGIEARHLRAWRQAADREAALFEQMVLPLLRQRNPQSKQQAADTLGDLARLGGELRQVMLNSALQHHLEP